MEKVKQDINGKEPWANGTIYEGEKKKIGKFDFSDSSTYKGII